MVSADDRLQGFEARFPSFFARPRAVLIVLFTFIALVGAALLWSAQGDPQAAERNWSLSHWLQNQGLYLVNSDLAEDGNGRGERGLEAKPWHQHRVCGRILQIVETACAYESADRDSETYWGCVAGELKYTMWSAYGCN